MLLRESKISIPEINTDMGHGFNYLSKAIRHRHRWLVGWYWIGE